MPMFGWFADVDEDSAINEYSWRPYLQCDGYVAGLDIWFETEEACNQWIRENVLDKRLIDDELEAESYRSWH